MLVGEVPIVLDWIGGAVVGLLAGAIWNWIVKGLTNVGERVRLVLAVTIAFVVGAGSVVALNHANSPEREDDTLEVLVVWDGTELARFERVVSLYGPNVQVESAGPAIREELDERFANGDPPDVAIIPQPSVVRHFARLGRIQPIGDDVVARFPDAWNSFVLGRHGSGTTDEYGAFVKGAHKSLLWYRPDAFEDGEPTPEDWSWTDFTSWVRANVDDSAFDAPLTLAVDNEWPLTDWFENQLAAIDPQLYDDLSDGTATDWSHDHVHDALHQIADLWQTEGIFDGGPEEVMDIQLEDLTTEISTRDAAIMFGPSFVAEQVDEMDPEDEPKPFGFPRLDGDRPQVVGGDIAVVSSESREGQRFVSWLTDQEAVNAWARLDAGFLTPNEKSPFMPESQVDMGPDEDLRRLLTLLLVSPAAGELHFDLSDEFGGVNEGRPCIVWRIFWNFFRDVTSTATDVTTAVNRVVDGLNAEAQGLETAVDCKERG